MTLSPPFKATTVMIPILMVLVAMVSFQTGAALAKQLFPLVGVAGATALRLGFAAALLLLVWRPWRVRPNMKEARAILIYGLAMGWMNFFFYLSLNRIPLGIAVSLEFMGPLAVAMATSRRAVDFLWIAMAIMGLLAFLPLTSNAVPVNGLGVLFALAAGVCWGLYIVFGQKAGHVHGGQVAALGTLVGALVVMPFGIAQAGGSLVSAAVLPLALAVAVFASALPYSLEMYALTRLPTRTFGVLMSFEPALGALSGFVFLHERLSVLQWSAVACIMCASAGAAATSRDVGSGLPD